MAGPGPRVGKGSRLGKLEFSISILYFLKYPFSATWVETSRERKICIQQLREVHPKRHFIPRKENVPPLLSFSSNSKINVLLKLLQGTPPLNRRKFKAIQHRFNFLH